MTSKTPYVVGFAFDAVGRVALVRKNRPNWQAGKLNGVGGHIEAGEAPQTAMAREFEEETGVTSKTYNWRPFAIVETQKSLVYMFAATFNPLPVETKTDEEINLFNVEDVDALDALPNLAWLIPMAQAADRFLAPARIQEKAHYET